MWFHFSGHVAGSGIARSVVTLGLTWWGTTARPVSKAAAHFHQRQWGNCSNRSNLPTFLPILVIICSFCYSHPSGCEAVPIVGLIWISLMMLNIFARAYWTRVYILWRTVYSSCLFILKLDCLIIIELCVIWYDQQICFFIFWDVFSSSRYFSDFKECR